MLVFVSDRGTNVKKALELFGAISCFAHMVNNLVDTMLIEISDLVVAVKALAKYFKVTGLNAALDTTLKSYVPTRWNTVFYMIESDNHRPATSLKRYWETRERLIESITLI